MSAGVVRVKQEPEYDGARVTSGLRAEQVRVKEELMTEASFTEEPLFELYADHVVKDELVLGPERPHRPTGGLVVRSWGLALDNELQPSPQKRAVASPPKIKDCFVQLERLDLHTTKTRSSRSERHYKTSEPLSTNKPTLRPKVNLKRCVNTKSEATGVLSAIEQSKRLQVKTINNASIKSKAEHDTKKQEIKASLRKKDEIESKAVKSTKQTKKQKVNVSEKHPYICDTCGKNCKFRHTLIQHLRYHLPDTLENLQINNSIKKPYSCDICQETFSWLDSLKRHLNSHAGKKRHTCEVCGKKFLESTCFKRHLLTHSKDRPKYPCDICSKTYAQSNTLKVHKRNVHLKLRLYSCDLCEKKYSTPNVLRNHRTSHFNEMPFICEICDKKFRNIDRLRVHKRIHVNQKPYSCEHCNRGFTESYRLNKHRLLHLKGKPISCKACKVRFATSSELYEHKQNNKIPYECEMCNNLFCEFRYFKKHLNRTHGLAKIYFCEICRIDLKTTDALNDHKQTHKGYSCGICQQNFTDNITLRKHKKTHKV